MDTGGSSRGRVSAAFAVRHALADHPLLTWEAIDELSDALPPSAIERHAASQPLLVPGGTPQVAARPSETVLDLERTGCSVVLSNIEQVPAYRELLDASLGEIEFLHGAGHRRALWRAGALVLSAPLAVTPARVDPEHHLLLQIVGDRQVNVGRFGSQEARVRALDRYHAGAHRNLDAIPHDTVPFDLHPGDGVYVPPFAPHWIRNGAFASISLSLTVRTPASRRGDRQRRFRPSRGTPA